MLSEGRSEKPPWQPIMILLNLLWVFRENDELLNEVAPCKIEEAQE